ncbi:MAG: hypothetical protein Q9227_001949 [Pyrenula ochraceoflavens]
MAPRKEKNEKSSAEQGQAIKLLKDLHDRREIECKASGKQLVYHALQTSSYPPSSSSSADDTTDHLASLDATITTLQSTLSSARSREKPLRAELAALTPTTTPTSNLSTADLRAAVASLEAEKSALQDTVTKLKGAVAEQKGGGGEPISEEERARVEAEWWRWRKVARGRKRICEEMWGKITEGGRGEEDGMTDEEFWENLGLEGKL